MIKKFSLPFIALLCCNIVSSAYDVSLDLAEGDVIISSTGYSHNGQSESGSFSYLITTSEATSNSLIIENGGTTDSPIEITLQDIEIDKDLLTEGHESAGAPIKVNSGYVTFILDGTNVAKSIEAYPGMALEGEAFVTIKGEGTLKVYGSEKDYGNQYTYRCGAGIGPDEKGSVEKPNGHLTVDSGNLYAYSMGGGYGFGNGAANVYNGRISGGSLTLNGGSAHFFGGHHPYKGYETEGIGSRHSGVTLSINGGELEAVLHEQTKISVKDNPATLKYLNGLSPYYVAKLPGMLGQADCASVSDNFGSLPYWTIEDETFDDFLAGRILLQGAGEPDQNTIHISGLGLFSAGEETELTAKSDNDVFIFDNWSFGSTENPVKYTVTEPATIKAVFKLDPQHLWTMSPIEGRDDECCATRFYAGHYFSGNTLEVPSTFVIDGKTYKVTQIGSEDQNCDFYFDFNSPKTIILPTTIVGLPSNLFTRLSMYSHGEPSIKKMVCKAPVPPALFGGDEFENLSDDCELSVPVKSISAYRNDPAWGKFSNITPYFGENDIVIDLSEGNVSITDNGYTLNDNVVETAGTYVLTTSSTSSNEITIAGGSKDKPLDIVLYNVDVDRWTSRGNGLSIPSGYINMWLAGNNNIRGGHDGAGIWLPAESTLCIDGDGKLTSKAGSTNNGAWLAGAGIGGAVGQTSVGQLIINSGSVYGYGLLGSAGFGSGSVWNYTNTSAPGYGVLTLNGGDAHFFGSADHQYNTVAVPEGVGTAANIAVVVFNNGGELEATLAEGTPVVTDGRNYEKHSQPGMTPNMKFTLKDHLGTDEFETTTDPNGNLIYWLAEGQTRKDVTGFDYAIEVYVDKDGYGKVTGGRMYNAGDEAEIAFVWERGNNDFASWSDGSAENPYRFTVTKDAQFTAMLEPNELRAWRVGRARDVETGAISETECYVSSFEGDGFEIDVLEIPSVFEIDGKEYTTTNVGDEMEGMFWVDIKDRLEDFILPATIKKVSQELGYVKTKVFTCLATTPPALIQRHGFLPEESEQGFGAIEEDAILRVPFGTASLYRTATGWKQFLNIEELRPEEETWLGTSHSDTECHIHGYGHPEQFAAEDLEVPEILNIDGTDYIVTVLGHPETGEINLNVEYAIQKFSLPSSIIQVSPFLFGVDEANTESVADAKGATNNMDRVKFVICKATVPPALTEVDGSMGFARIPSDATLVVPEGSKEMYATARGWRDFSSISDNMFTSVDEIIENFDNAEIFTLQGVKVNRSINSLASGIYIVRSGNKTAKVIVK